MPDNNYGINTVATQQLQPIIRERKSTNLNLHKRCEEDLRDFIDWFTDGSTLLSGDLNLPATGKFLRTLQIAYGLADVVREIYEENYQDIPASIYGKERIDHVLASWELLPYINDVRIDDCEHMKSDHLPVTFNLQWPAKKRNKKKLSQIKLQQKIPKTKSEDMETIK